MRTHATRGHALFIRFPRSPRWTRYKPMYGNAFPRLLRLSAHLCSLCVQTRHGDTHFTPSGVCSTASFVYIFHSRHTRKHLPAAVLPYPRTSAPILSLPFSPERLFYLPANLLHTRNEYSCTCTGCFSLFFPVYSFRAYLDLRRLYRVDSYVRAAIATEGNREIVCDVSKGLSMHVNWSNYISWIFGSLNFFFKVFTT